MFRTKNRDRGVAFLMAMMMIAIVLGLSVTLLTYVTSTNRAAKLFESEVATVQIADAGIQKALFCLKTDDGANCGGTYGDDYAGETGLVMNNRTFDIAIDCVGQSGGGGCDVADSDLLITSTSTDSSGATSTVQAIATKQALVSENELFNFAIQVGGDLFETDKDVKICRGDVYSSSDMDCSSGGRILGDVYVSGEGGRVESCNVRGDVHADYIKKSTICCDAYYDDGISGSSKVGGTLYPNTPPPESLPLPEMNLEYWRSVSEAGGIISGDYTPGNGTELGPVKIDGDLTLNNNVQVTLTGPIWVTGNLELKNNSSIVISGDFGTGSTVVLVDNPDDISAGGKIVLNNNAFVAGSNHSGSYIILISTNDSMSDGSGKSKKDNCAIEIENNSTGDAIFYAVNGCVLMHNNTSVAAVAGQGVIMDKHVVVSYGCEVGCDESSGGSKLCDCPDAGSGDTSCWCGAEAPEDTSACPTPGDIVLMDGPGVWQLKPGTWHEL